MDDDAQLDIGAQSFREPKCSSRRLMPERVVSVAMSESSHASARTGRMVLYEHNSRRHNLNVPPPRGFDARATAICERKRSAALRASARLLCDQAEDLQVIARVTAKGKLRVVRTDEVILHAWSAGTTIGVR